MKNERVPYVPKEASELCKTCTIRTFTLPFSCLCMSYKVHKMCHYFEGTTREKQDTCIKSTALSRVVKHVPEKRVAPGSVILFFKGRGGLLRNLVVRTGVGQYDSPSLWHFACVWCVESVSALVVHNVQGIVGVSSNYWAVFFYFIGFVIAETF